MSESPKPFVPNAVQLAHWTLGPRRASRIINYACEGKNLDEIRDIMGFRKNIWNIMQRDVPKNAEVFLAARAIISWQKELRMLRSLCASLETLRSRLQGKE